MLKPTLVQDGLYGVAEIFFYKLFKLLIDFLYLDTIHNADIVIE